MRATASMRSALMLVSMATLLFEILLTRIFSVTMWYHFAFMAISIAMFGMTLGALRVYRSPRRYPQETLGLHLGNLALALAGSFVLSVLAHVYAPFADMTAGRVPLTYTFALSAIPFVISGIFICLMLTRFPDQVGALYAVDLLGAALGCLGLFMILKLVDGVSAAFVCGAIAAGAALVLRWHAGPARRWAAAISVILLTAIPFWAGVTNQRHGASPFWISSAKQIPLPPLFERWNSFSRVSVTENVTNMPVAWSLSEAFRGTVDVRSAWLQIDGWAGTPLMQFDGHDFRPLEFLRYDITNFVHHLRPDSSVAIVGSGGGRDILGARLFDQRKILAVEMNDNIVDTVHRRFGDFTGHLDRDPRVTIVSDEARSYLTRQGDRFDIVQMSFIDTWAATAAGAYVLSENSLYTVEGWRVFLDHLTDRGLLAVSRATVPAEMHRLVALARGTLTSLGIEHPARHIAMVANFHTRRPPSWGDMALLLVGRQPLSPETIDTIDRTAERLGFTVILKPGFAQDRIFAALASGNGLEAVRREVRLNYDPPTDDSPFFFNMLRPRDWLRADLERVTVPAMTMLVNVLLIVTLLTVVCIVLPLGMRGGARMIRGATALLLFFAAIGVGFMLVEVSVMQRLIIFLGHPVYGLTVILFVLLLAGGGGAYLSIHIPQPARYHGVLAMAGLCAVLVVCGGLTTWLVREFAGSSTAVRIATAAAVLGVMGLFMGMAFPLGMRAAGRRPDLTPWLWGINGAMSVLASVLGIVIAIGSGISTAYWLGVAAYLVALGAYVIATAPYRDISGIAATRA